MTDPGPQKSPFTLPRIRAQHKLVVMSLQGKKEIDLTIECINCKKDIKYVALKYQDYVSWVNGQPIQQCMPYLTPGERETLVSNLCETCFDEITKE